MLAEHTKHFAEVLALLGACAFHCLLSFETMKSFVFPFLSHELCLIMMYLQMYNGREFVIAYYDEKDIVLGANVRLVKLIIRLQFYMYVVGIIHVQSLD